MKIIDNIQYNKDPRRIDLEGRVLVAHQPEFLPWLGFLSKAAMGDIYIIFDNDQYKKNTFQNRNRIRTNSNQGSLMLTVPILDANRRIMPMNKVIIAGGQWKKKHLRTLEQNYSKAPFFNQYIQDIYEIYNKSFEYLVDFNIEIILYAFKIFEITPKIFRISELIDKGVNFSGKSSELLISFCNYFGANTYVFGQTGREYFDSDLFSKNGILPVFQNFMHPNYKQIHNGFIPNMSFIDLIFNHGPNSKEILGKSNYEF